MEHFKSHFVDEEAGGTYTHRAGQEHQLNQKPLCVPLYCISHCLPNEEDIVSLVFKAFVI